MSSPLLPRCNRLAAFKREISCRLQCDFIVVTVTVIVTHRLHHCHRLHLLLHLRSDVGFVSRFPPRRLIIVLFLIISFSSFIITTSDLRRFVAVISSKSRTSMQEPDPQPDMVQVRSDSDWRCSPNLYQVTSDHTRKLQQI